MWLKYQEYCCCQVFDPGRAKGFLTTVALMFVCHAVSLCKTGKLITFTFMLIGKSNCCFSTPEEEPAVSLQIVMNGNSKHSECVNQVTPGLDTSVAYGLNSFNRGS